MELELPTRPTQYAFAICILLVAPVFAVFAASIQQLRGESPWKGALLAGAASWAGWVVSGIVAAALFPTYARNGPPSEPVAMLFVVPGLIAGFVVLRWLGTRKAATRRANARRRALLAATVVLAALLAVGLVTWHIDSTTWPARKALPEGAQVIDERARVDDWLGDSRLGVNTPRGNHSRRRQRRTSSSI